MKTGLSTRNQQLSSSIFSILKKRAQGHQTITYEKLGGMVGVYHRSRIFHSALGSIWHWCEQSDLPHINALVVRKSGNRKDLPGVGYTPNGQPVSATEWGRLKGAIYGHNWNAVSPPSRWPVGHCGA